MEFGLEPASGVPPASELLVLPPPQRRGGAPLMEALGARRSSREFDPRDLPLHLLSSLLWAAFGVNRPETQGRTAPSAHDWEEIDILVALASGLYGYEAHGHVLRRRLARDIRAHTGGQAFAAQAPVNLVYVADLSRMVHASAEERAWYAGPDAGFIAQNVYLFCASVGLASVVRGMIDRPALARLIGLSAHHSIILAQSVGYPAGR